MATVNLTWTTVSHTPVATDLMQYKASIDGVGEQFIPFGTLSASFADVKPGDYIARVALSNANGSILEAEKSQAFTVPTVPILLDAPDVVTVTLA